jgi:hypothetical protein
MTTVSDLEEVQLFRPANCGCAPRSADVETVETERSWASCLVLCESVERRTERPAWSAVAVAAERVADRFKVGAVLAHMDFLLRASLTTQRNANA